MSNINPITLPGYALVSPAMVGIINLATAPRIAVRPAGDATSDALAAQARYESMRNAVVYTELAIGAVGAGLGVLHGYKRSGGKAGSMALYGIAGFVFPFLTTAFELGQGFAKPKRT